MYFGKKVMKPEMMVISKQNAKVTIMKILFAKMFLMALGKP